MRAAAPSPLHCAFCAICAALVPCFALAASGEEGVKGACLLQSRQEATKLSGAPLLLHSIDETDAQQSAAVRAQQVASLFVQHKVLRRELAEHLERFISTGCLGGPRAGAKICEEMIEFCSSLITHQRTSEDTLSVYLNWVKRTTSQVMDWHIDAAAPNSTDKVAVIVLLQGRVDSFFPQNVEYVVKSVMKRLGPQWALQVFYGDEGQKEELVRSLGSPKNVAWTLATKNGSPFSPDKAAYNDLFWSAEFYKAMHPGHEHILVFELDSLLLRSNCADTPEILEYDLVGAPTCWSACNPRHFMNGGFGLRSKSAMLQAVEKWGPAEMRDMTNGDPNEDTWTAVAFGKLGLKFAPKETAAAFSMESLAVTAPCGFHKPWIFTWITPEVMQAALDAADFPPAQMTD